MRILTVVHQPDAGAGEFGAQARADEHELIEWVPAEGGPPPPAGQFDAAMVFGGAMHVDQEDRHPWLADEKRLVAGLLERGVPTLGVCLGAQIVAEAAGAAPRRAARPEIGWHAVELTDEGAADPLLGALPRRFEALSWHSYEWPLPPGAVALARSEVCLQGFRVEGAPVWGVQFHPEVTQADFWRWIDNFEADEDAVRVGVDPEALRAQTEPRIRAWNELGRGIAARFFEAASYSGVT